MTIYVLSGFNNYYNRMVKKFDTINEYEPYVLHTQENYNFVPNDNVSTQVVLGSNVNLYDGTGDYLLAVNEFNEIISRWFIIESVRDRAGQYTLTLYRDLVADHYDQLLNAPMFIEKATLIDDDPLIFNSENMTFNQIKKGNYSLYNKLQTPWVVAYLSRKAGDGTYNSFTGEFIYNRMPVQADYEFDSLSEYDYYNLFGQDYTLTDNIKFRCEYYYPSSSVKYRYFLLSGPGSFNATYTSGYTPGYESWPVREANQNLSLTDAATTYNEMLTEYNNYVTITNGVPYNTLTGVGTIDGFSRLSEEIGKTIKVGENYYRITGDVSISEYELENNFQMTKGTSIYDAMLNRVVIPCGLTTTDSTTLSASVQLPFEMTRFTLNYEPIEAEKQIAYDFNYNNGAVTTDAVYEIIATPLYTKTFTVTDEVSITSQGSFGLQWFQALAQDNSTKVYDVQIVPYIPIDSLDIRSYEYVTAYQKGVPTSIYALAIKLPKSSFNVLLDVPQEAISIVSGPNSNVKIGSETELWRITSPNGVGSFDFNPYKNKSFNLIEADCTLLPINPYIKINPLFNPNGLYGGDYDDYRGLICGGDFSIALTNNEWQTYQQQNKNFQSIFDRQIESMELQNKVGKTQDIVSAIAGTGAGAASGALAGGMFGGGYGAIAGGLIGGVTSAIGGIADISINEMLRNDALDLTIDQFNYNLGNIQARANKLTRSTSFNINNKYFPYIEFFTCTGEEKRALANKIAWNGMSVGVIGKIIDYIDNTWSYQDIESKGYIKGKLIRLETINDDYHIINALAGELNKGVYI